MQKSLEDIKIIVHEKKHLHDLSTKLYYTIAIGSNIKILVSARLDMMPYKRSSL